MRNSKRSLQCREEQAFRQVGESYLHEARTHDVCAGCQVLAPEGKSLKGRELGQRRDPSKMTRLLVLARVTISTVLCPASPLHTVPMAPLHLPVPLGGALQAREDGEMEALSAGDPLGGQLSHDARTAARSLLPLILSRLLPGGEQQVCSP